MPEQDNTPEKYKRLADGLRDRLQSIEKQIDLIENARKNNRPITLKESEILNRPSEPLRDSEIALVIQAKSERRKAKGKSYEPILLVDSQTNDFARYLAGQDLAKEFQYDLILKKGVHCSAAQVHSQDGKRARVFYVDSAGDIRNLTNAFSLSKGAEAEQLRYVYGTLAQKDGFSCSIFSLQDLNTMSNLTEAELDGSLSLSSKNLSEDEERTKLNPRFLKNSQSQTDLLKYSAGKDPKSLKVTKKGKTLNDYVEDYSVDVEIAGQVNPKRRNFAILFKTGKYLSNALDILESGRDVKEIDEIMDQRLGYEELRSVYKDLSAEEREQVQGFYNKKQIDLILHHGMSPEQAYDLNEAFMNKEVTNKIYKYIVSAESEEEKRSRISNIADFIKNMGNDNEVAFKEPLNAIVEFGIVIRSEDDISLCSEEVELREIVYLYIKQAYDQAPDGEKTQRAQECFDLLKDLSSKEEVIAIQKAQAIGKELKGFVIRNDENIRPSNVKTKTMRRL